MDSVTQLHVFLRTIKVASVLILITEPTKHTLGSGASNKYAHDLNLVRLKCDVECGLGSIQTGRANVNLTASLLFKIFDATRPV